MKLFLKTMLFTAIFLPQIGYAQNSSKSTNESTPNTNTQNDMPTENMPRGGRISEKIAAAAKAEAAKAEAAKAAVKSVCFSDQAEIVIKAEKDGELSITPDKTEITFKKDNLEHVINLDISTNLLNEDHQLSYTATQLIHEKNKNEKLNYTMTLDDNARKTTTDKEETLSQAVTPAESSVKKVLKVSLSKEAFEKALKGKFIGGNIRITVGVGC